MIGYTGPIEEQTLKNTYFRQVLFTGKHAQLVVMSLRPGEEIGNEVHPNVDQFFRIEQGEARFVLDQKEERLVRDGGAVVVPAGTYHNVINASKTTDLKLYTVYSPPNHPDGTVHKTKAEADKAEEAGAPFLKWERHGDSGSMAACGNSTCARCWSTSTPSSSAPTRSMIGRASCCAACSATSRTCSSASTSMARSPSRSSSGYVRPSEPSRRRTRR